MVDCRLFNSNLLQINSIFRTIYLHSMTSPLQAQDAFYLTFGKQNWTPLNKKTPPQQANQPGTTKKPVKTPDQNKYHLRTTRLSQHIRPKPFYNSELFKQNIDYNRQTVRRSHPKSSLTDRQFKQSLDFVSIRQQMPNELAMTKPHKSARRYQNLFDANLPNGVKCIETAATLRLERTKTTSEYRKPFLKNEPEIVYDKYRLINSQTARKPRFVPANPSILKYKQEITKIDSLINRINARISSSASKNQNEYKNYSFEKA